MMPHSPRRFSAVSLFLLCPLVAGCPSEPDNTLFQACVRSTACHVRAYPRVSNCVDNYKNLMVPQGLGAVFDAIYRCVSGASTCQQVRTCFGVTGACDSSYKASCPSGKALFCDLIDKTTFTYDCPANNLTCQIDTKNSFSATCVGSGPVAAGELPVTVDCADGLCEKTGQACTGDEFDRCDGERLLTCLDKEWVRFDCKGLGLDACYLSSTSIGACAPVQ